MYLLTDVSYFELITIRKEVVAESKDIVPAGGLDRKNGQVPWEND